MTASLASAFRSLANALPPLGAGDELVLREDGGAPAALVRPADGPPRNFVLDGECARELRLADDGGLPAAATAADGDALAAALSPHLGTVDSPRLVAWRPARRAVVRVHRGGETWFVKLLDKKTWKRAQAAFAGLGRAPAPLRLAVPALLLPELSGYAVPSVAGTSLREHLAKNLSVDWPLVDSATQALAATAGGDGLPRHDFATARDAAVKMLQKGAAMQPRLGEVAARVAELPVLAVRREGLVHGDYHDKQLFLAGREAFLIDLEGLGRGDTDFDLVNLAEHLRLRALQQTGRDDGQAEAMLERNHFPPELRMPWRLCIRARLLGVYAMRPRWAHLTDVLLSEVDVQLSANR